MQKLSSGVGNAIKVLEHVLIKNLEVNFPTLIKKFKMLNNFLNLQLTWADFYFAGIIDYLNYLAKQDLTVNCENLRKVIENVTSLDGVQNWINSRPATEI